MRSKIPRPPLPRPTPLPRVLVVAFWLLMALIIACAGLQLDVTHAGKRIQVETTPDEEGDQAVSIIVTDAAEEGGDQQLEDTDEDEEDAHGADPVPSE